MQCYQESNFVSGLAQCAELCWQLRGLAGKRQVKGAKVALQHNIGIGGAVVVSLYKMGYPQKSRYSRTSQFGHLHKLGPSPFGRF